MLHPKIEVTLLAYVASLIGQILCLLHHAADPVSANVRTALLKQVQALPPDAQNVALSLMRPPADLPADRKRWTELQEAQVKNYTAMRERFAAEHGDDFAAQVFDGQDAPADPTSQQLAAAGDKLRDENTQLRRTLQELSDRMALLERGKVPGPAPETKTA